MKATRKSSGQDDGDEATVGCETGLRRHPFNIFQTLVNPCVAQGVVSVEPQWYVFLVDIIIVINRCVNL